VSAHRPTVPTTMHGLRQALEESDRLEAARIDYNSPDVARRSYIEDLPITHPEMTDVLDVITYWRGRHAGGRIIKWLYLDSSFHDGKSHIALRAMLDVCREVRSRNGLAPGDLIHAPDGSRHVNQPAVAFNIGAGTELAIAVALAQSAQVPAAAWSGSHVKADSLIDVIAGQFARSETELCVADEAHRLSSKRGVHLTGFLKRLVEQSGVTLLFVGQDIAGTPLLKASSNEATELHAVHQLHKRKKRLPYLPIVGDAKGVKTWVDLVDAVAPTFPLRAEPVLEEGDYLWLMKTCARSRGDLLEVLRTAAAEAVGAEERINRASLERAVAVVIEEPTA
jgi:hypothetical protein